MAQTRVHDSAAARQAAYRARQAQAAQRAQQGLPSLPGTARWKALLQQAQWSLQTTCEEMQSYAAARSESWQESERGEAFAERLTAMEEVLSSLQELFTDD